MSDSPAAFYDALAADHHLVFADWEAAIERQARLLGGILERECGAGRLRLLDCACGIGTQALGLAARGHIVVASDISGGAVARARREAAGRGLDILFHVADMRELQHLPEGGFDAVLAADNALPHLSSEPELGRAALSMHSRLRPGGVLLATIRDYDRALAERPTVTPPAFYSDGGRRRIVHQVWEWLDERTYRFHLYITRETADGWECRHFVSTYRGLLRAELDAVLQRAGFTEVRWSMPEESGHYQPLITARKA